MKKLVISIATAGLLISAGAAFSQTPSPTVQKDAPAQSTASKPQAAPTTAPAANQGTTSTQRSGASAQTGERREGARRAEGGERRGERHEGGARTGINIRVGGGDPDGYRHRRGGFGYAQVGGHCRTVIVKSFRHGHRVIKRIRRCW
jgi:hypothetical protein